MVLDWLRKKIFGVDLEKKNKEIQLLKKKIQILQNNNVKLKEKLKKQKELLKECQEKLKNIQESFNKYVEVKIYFDAFLSSSKTKNEGSNVSFEILGTGVVNKKYLDSDIEKEFSYQLTIHQLIKKLNINLGDLGSIQNIKVGVDSYNTQQPTTDHFNFEVSKLENPFFEKVFRDSNKAFATYENPFTQ